MKEKYKHGKHGEMKKTTIKFIKLYQMTRIFRPSACRFYPACSDYTIHAIDKHGLMKGIILGAFRLIRCQPLHPGGIDEVPT